MSERFARGGFVISTDRKRLDPRAIHAYLARSYWAKGRKLAAVKKSLAGSHCFGLYRGKEQVGFARVVTDYATFAYLADVYVRPDLQGAGLGKWLVSCIMKSRALKGVPRWLLATKDAHGLYRGFGFKTDTRKNRWMRLQRDA